MCLNIFSYKSHPDYKLIIAANRDEFYSRNTEAAHFWEEHPDLLAGRDLVGKGTWLGITKTGRFAFITNYRDPKAFRNDALSRGVLVSGFLTGTFSPAEYIEKVKNPKDYNSFNLVVGNLDEAVYFSNAGAELQKLGSGFYGLSNAFLNTPWKKLERSKKLVEAAINKKNFTAEDVFAALRDEQKTEDSELPATGVPYEIEKLVSSTFIKSETYGTVCSTVVLVNNDNRVQFFERTCNPLKENKTVNFEFIIS